MNYRWYNEDKLREELAERRLMSDKEREQRAIRDESRNVPLWEEYRKASPKGKSDEKPVEVKSLWHAVKILWSL